MTLVSQSVCDTPDIEGDVGSNPRPARDHSRGQSLDRWMNNFRSSLWQSEPSISMSRLSRAIDIVGASLILLIALPFLCLLACLLAFDSPGPLFFIQRRIGRGGREFSCIKFRTMCKNADAALQQHLSNSSAARLEWARDQKLRADPRITRLGALVRKFSLDEFPQLINIIKGEMSLVGPRPIVASEISRYGGYFNAYCAVRPGLTGLWQVSGRNNVSYRRRVSIDCYYVRNKSVLLDMAILLRTGPAVLWAKGSY